MTTKRKRDLEGSGMLAAPMHRQEGHWPTPTEWVDRFMAATPEQRVQTAERVIEAAQMADECFRMNHRDMQSALNSALPVGRVGSIAVDAWLSLHPDNAAVVADAAPALAAVLRDGIGTIYKPPTE